MLEKVIAIVAEGLGVEAGNLNAETTFESLGADCHVFQGDRDREADGFL